MKKQVFFSHCEQYRRDYPFAHAVISSKDEFVSYCYRYFWEQGSEKKENEAWERFVSNESPGFFVGGSCNPVIGVNDLERGEMLSFWSKTKDGRFIALIDGEREVWLNDGRLEPAEKGGFSTAAARGAIKKVYGGEAGVLEAIADFREEARIAEEERLADMNSEARGWYVVTLDVSVLKFRGNDGRKTYSFRVLANSKMDAYERVCKLIETQGVNDSNVMLVQHICGTWKSADIDFVGIWTDDAELEYGETKEDPA